MTFLGGGGRGGGKKQEELSFLCPIPHLKILRQFIIRLFGCILVHDMLHVFPRFTLGIPRIGQPHNLL